MKRTTKDRWFKWEGVSNDGEKISGLQLQNSKQATYDSLLADNITPLRIKKTIHFKQKTTASQKDILCFLQQLSTLIKAGVELDRALALLEQQNTNEAIKKLMTKLCIDIKNGFSLNEAIKKFPHYFSHIDHALISAGEDSS